MFSSSVLTRVNLCNIAIHTKVVRSPSIKRDGVARERVRVRACVCMPYTFQRYRRVAVFSSDYGQGRVSNQFALYSSLQHSVARRHGDWAHLSPPTIILLVVHPSLRLTSRQTVKAGTAACRSEATAALWPWHSLRPCRTWHGSATGIHTLLRAVSLSLLSPRVPDACSLVI